MGLSAVQFPSWWILIGLGGLVLDFVGATLLAVSGTEMFNHWADRVIRSRFITDARFAEIQLREKGQLSESDPEFTDLNDVLSHYFQKEIDAFEYEPTERPIDDEIRIKFSTGEIETYDEDLLDQAIHEFKLKMSETLKDRVTLVLGLLLVFGFGMQIISYVARYLFT